MTPEEFLKEVQEREGLIVECNLCLNCLKNKEFGGWAFVPYEIGESKALVVWVCPPCIQEDLTSNQRVIDNVLATMRAQKLD